MDGIGGGVLGIAGLTIPLTDIGRFTMVLAGMFEEWVRRRRARQMAEAIEEAVGEAVTAALTENNALWRAWNGRRLDALAKGEPFDEPPPEVSGVSRNGR